MSSDLVDDLAKQLLAEGERLRLKKEAEAKAAGSAPAPDMSAALEKLTRALTEGGSTPLRAPQPTGGTEHVADNKKSH